MTTPILKEKFKKAIFLSRAHVLTNRGTFADVEDILQEGLRIYCENLQKEDFELQTSQENYIYLICKELWLSEIRKQNLETRRSNQVLLNYLGLGRNLEDVIRKERLLKIIYENEEEFPEKTCEILVKRIMGFSLKQIALEARSGDMKTARKKYRKELNQLKELVSSGADIGSEWDDRRKKNIAAKVLE